MTDARVKRLATQRRVAAIRSVTVIVPVKDEQDTLEPLATSIFDAISRQVDKFEIVFVDDGSADESWHVMCDLAERHPGRVRALRLRRNFGKSTALAAGFQTARGDVIFTMDADLQDDPKEMPRFLQKLDEGFDLVSGWKRRRNDPLSKTMPSWLFNVITRRMTGIKLHDFNCGFKAYRRAVVEHLRLYGELHRYTAVLANDAGFRIDEIEVEHHPRVHGASKYGIERYLRGLLDLITILATTRYLQRPGHLFGGLGVALGLLGVLIFSYLSILWLLGEPIGHRPLLFISFLLMIFSVHMISLGIVGELMIHLYNPREVRSLIAEEASFPDNSGRLESSAAEAIDREQRTV